MNRRTLSTHILRALAEAQTEGHTTNLETLVDELKIRRADVRGALTQLHQEGMLDVLRMRLTLSGFAIGKALRVGELSALRSSPMAAVSAA